MKMDDCVKTGIVEEAEINKIFILLVSLDELSRKLIDHFREEKRFGFAPYTFSPPKLEGCTIYNGKYFETVGLSQLKKIKLEFPGVFVVSFMPTPARSLIAEIFEKCRANGLTFLALPTSSDPQQDLNCMINLITVLAPLRNR